MKRKDLDFLFLLEINYREENSLILLCEELKRRGYSAEYLMTKDWVYKRYDGNVKVLIYNGAETVKEVGDHVYAIAVKVDYFVVLRWEQIYSNLFVKRISTEAERLCNTAKTFNFFCWGDDYYNRLLQTGIEKKYLHKVGPIQMDFLRPEFSSIYKKRNDIFDEFSIDRDKKIILFISSFGFFSINDLTDLELKQQKELYGTDELLKERIDFNNTCQKIILEWFEKFLKTHEEWEIIYRPHPAVHESEAINVLERKYDNFKVILKYSLQQWIVVADSICTVESTSIAEVFFAGKSCAVLRPVPLRWELDVEFYDKMNICDEYDKFVTAVEKGEKVDYKVIKKYYDCSDRPYFMRWCDELIDLSVNQENTIVWDSYELDEIIKEATYINKKTYDEERRHWFRRRIKEKMNLWFYKHEPSSKLGKYLAKRTFYEIQNSEINEKISNIVNKNLF